MVLVSVVLLITSLQVQFTALIIPARCTSLVSISHIHLLINVSLPTTRVHCQVVTTQSHSHLSTVLTKEWELTSHQLTQVRVHSTAIHLFLTSMPVLTQWLLPLIVLIQLPSRLKVAK